MQSISDKRTSRYSFIILLLCSSVVKSQDSLHHKTNWFNLAFQGALVLNNSFSNLSSEEMSVGNLNYGFHYSEAKYSQIKSRPLCFGFSGGIEMKLGKNPVVNHLFDLNYDYTNSYYNLKTDYVQYYAGGRSSGFSENINIKRTVQFLGIGYGLILNFKRHFNFSCTANLSYPIYIKNIYKADFNPNLCDTCNTSLQLSFRFRFGYNFLIKKESFNFFALGNLGSITLSSPSGYYVAPWWMIGIQYLPKLKSKS